MIEQVKLKNKLIIFIIASICFLGLVGILYIVGHYDTATAVTKVDKKTMPDGTQVNVTINNVLATAGKPIETLPMIQSKENIHQTEQLLKNPPVVEDREIQKPKALAVGFEDSSNNEVRNSVTNADSSVGVGETNTDMKPMRSPYTIFAGTFIPSTLITGLNSDLNGEIVAIVRNNVYDTTSGKYLLIPQGSRLVGTYNHEIAYAQDRLIVAWNRVIYPNGTSFVLRGQPGTDLQGYSGLSGTVDNHWDKIFGAAFLIGGITAGATLATGNQASNPYVLSPGAVVATSVGSQLSSAGIQVVQKGLNIPPTIKIPPGYKFNILTTADLVLKPYILR